MKRNETVPSGVLHGMPGPEDDRRERVYNQKRKRDEAASIFMKRLDRDRKIVGMQPAEMWGILETKGIEELRAELDWRLTKKTSPGI